MSAPTLLASPPPHSGDWRFVLPVRGVLLLDAHVPGWRTSHRLYADAPMGVIYVQVGDDEAVSTAAPWGGAS